MKNYILVGIFLLFSLKSFAMQLTSAQLTNIYQGKFNVYFDDRYHSPIKYGCDQLIEKATKIGEDSKIIYTIPKAMPFITGWVEKKGNKIAVDVPFLYYLQQKGKKHEESYIRLKFSSEYAIIYTYKKFIDQKDFEKDKGMLSQLIEKLIGSNKASDCYLNKQKYSDFLNDLRNKQSAGQNIKNFALLIDYDSECSKEELYNTDNSGARTLLEEERLEPLKRVEYSKKIVLNT